MPKPLNKVLRFGEDDLEQAPDEAKVLIDECLRANIQIMFDYLTSLATYNRGELRTLTSIDVNQRNRLIRFPFNLTIQVQRLRNLLTLFFQNINNENTIVVFDQSEYSSLIDFLKQKGVSRATLAKRFGENKGYYDERYTGRIATINLAILNGMKRLKEELEAISAFTPVLKKGRGRPKLIRDDRFNGEDLTKITFEKTQLKALCDGIPFKKGAIQRLMIAKLKKRGIDCQPKRLYSLLNVHDCKKISKDEMEVLFEILDENT